MRRLLPVVAAIALVIAAAACTPEERNAFEQVNGFRSGHGVPALEWHGDLYDKARSWSERMAREGRISHSVLTAGAPAGWKTLGENVGVASTLDGALRALEASPSHRANLLDRRFRWIAIGVVESGGRVWVTQVFMG